MKRKFILGMIAGLVSLYFVLLFSCELTSLPSTQSTINPPDQIADTDHYLSTVQFSKTLQLQPEFSSTTFQYEILLEPNVSQISVVDITPTCLYTSDSYKLEYSHTSGSATSQRSATNTALQTDLCLNDRLKILVISANSEIKNTYQFVVKSTPQIIPVTNGNLNIPANFSLDSVHTKEGWVYFEWEDNNSNETGIILESKSKNGPDAFQEIKNIAFPNTTWTALDNVTPGIYLYRIKAYNHTNQSDYSNIVEVTVHPYPQAVVSNFRLCTNVTEDGISKPGHNLYWDVYDFPSYSGYDIEYGYKIYYAKWLRTLSVIPDLNFVSAGTRKVKESDNSQTRIFAQIPYDSLSDSYMYTYQICLYYKYSITLNNGTLKEIFYEGPMTGCASSSSK